MSAKSFWTDLKRNPEIVYKSIDDLVCRYDLSKDEKAQLLVLQKHCRMFKEDELEDRVTSAPFWML